MKHVVQDLNYKSDTTESGSNAKTKRDEHFDMLVILQAFFLLLNTNPKYFLFESAKVLYWQCQQKILFKLQKLPIQAWGNFTGQNDSYFSLNEKRIDEIGSSRPKFWGIK